MTDPQPIDELIVVTVSPGLSADELPSWVSDGATYQHREVSAWEESQDRYRVVSAGSVQINTGYGDLKVFEIGLA